MDLVQGAFKFLDSWCRGKAMSIQGMKSTDIIFTRGYKIKNLARMLVRNSDIQFVEETKYQDVILDTMLL